jgi:hypothetical protein
MSAKGEKAHPCFFFFGKYVEVEEKKSVEHVNDKNEYNV